GGECFFNIKKGTLRTEAGRAPRADLTVHAPFNLWMDIMTGKADGQSLFMEGAYQVEGDLNLLMDMKNIFGGNA
ncbi:MAG: SCP2 sterol-binding domain-containing protein, partial [Syntrophales bacterium]|nr:SCP2 sterol-binding domain-containing protein [Syntrophales bacterium]